MCGKGEITAVIVQVAPVRTGGDYLRGGKSGLRVSEAALGTMTFGDERGWGSPKDEAQKVNETYCEAG